jgi:SAM-dependent methyltransferase
MLRRRDLHPTQVLRSISPLRSAVYFALELRRVFGEDGACSKANFDNIFRSTVDPWDYGKSPIVQELFRRETELLDQVRRGKLFPRAVEIGCAEGHFTELLADRCGSLEALELSPTALERARTRRAWSDHIRFSKFDLRRDPLPGRFDLVVVTGVLEYFARRSTFYRVRDKLAAAVVPGGHLMIETTRPPRVIDDSRWAPFLIRGRWINSFIARHSLLRTVDTFMNEHFIITLLTKIS